MSMPSYTALRAFEAVVRLGTVRAAAAELHVTQSAISHLLRDLEAKLEVRLLERKGRNVAATDSGERLAIGLREGFARMHSAVEEVAHSMRAKQLTVACLPSVAARWLVPRLANFRQARPDIQLRIQYSGNASNEKSDQDVDLEISWLDGAFKKRPNVFKLFDGSTYPVCSPLYMDRFGGIRKPADLLGVDLLHDQTTDSWKDWFRKNDLTPPATKKAPVFEDFNLMSIAVLAGHGVALSPLTLMAPELENGTLIRLFDSPANATRNYCLVVKRHTAEADAFVQWALEQVASS